MSMSRTNPRLSIPLWLVAAMTLTMLAPWRANAGETDAAWRNHVRPLAGTEDLSPLIEQAGEKRLVLLGEASHGTHEFYTLRTAITRKLIEQHGFNFIAVEGDWVLCQILNSYILGEDGAPDSARAALLQFDRWPLWMWANQEIVELAEWLHQWNRQRPRQERVGFYGLDVYGMWDSLDAVLEYIRRNHPRQLPQFEELYSRLRRFHGDGHSYARSLARGEPSARQQTAAALELIRQLPEPDSEKARERRFMAMQNAWVVKYGEKHFRAMLRRGPHSWNERVEHMKNTADRLRQRYGSESRGVIWAHNTHIGDARATTMSMGGQKNIGQLAREKWGQEQVYAVGFGTYHGEVMAGRAWGAEPNVMTVPDAMPGSLEHWLAELFDGDLLILFDEIGRNTPWERARGHRAIGVVYDPTREQPGNYVQTIAPARYDAFIFVRRSQPVRPLHHRR